MKKPYINSVGRELIQLNTLVGSAIRLSFEFEKLKKSLFADLHKCEKRGLNSFLFRMSVKTPYSTRQIHEFVSLSGFKYDEAERILLVLSDYGVSSLNDINLLLKLGYVNF